MNPLRVTLVISALATLSLGATIAVSEQDSAASSPEAAVVAPAPEAPTTVERPTTVSSVATTVSTLPVRSALDAPEAPPAGPQPVGLRLPALAIDASVDEVGVDEAQRLEVPEVDRIGWYRFGARPGEPGATVLAGHVDYGGEAGVFWELRAAEPGDVVEVVMDDGTTRDYVVTDVTLYDKTELPNDELFRRTGSEAIHLITCGGTFDRIQRSYRGNVVVTAIPA